MFRTSLIAAGLIAINTLAIAPASAQSAMGDRNSITARGTVDNQVALAIGALARAHNNVGSLVVGDSFRMGNRNTISTNGTAKNQVALSIGALATASNTVGGVTIMGMR
jgi:hypothetical protein